jgi:sporulation protein YlmC with PRC-barrel domain
MGAALREGAGILMRISELLNREVVTESGRRLGRIHDVRGELRGNRLLVTGLIAGKRGILERYGIGTHGSGGPGQARVHGQEMIPWDRIVRVGLEITVTDERPSS